MTQKKVNPTQETQEKVYKPTKEQIETSFARIKQFCDETPIMANYHTHIQIQGALINIAYGLGLAPDPRDNKKK